MFTANKIAALLTVSLFAIGSLAHHVISDDIDSTIRKTLEGQIVDVEWINPHVIIHIEVMSEQGFKQRWLVQADTPNTLLRSGLNRNWLQVASKVSVEVFPSTSASCGTTCLSYGINITSRSGQTMPLNTILEEVDVLKY